MAEHRTISAAIVVESDEVSYVLKVDGYSRAKALLKNGECMTSTHFGVGGHDFVVRYYPNGSRKNYPDFISVYLFLEHVDAEDVKAKYTFSVLDLNGEPVPSYSLSSRGYQDFVKKADLKGSAHLRDDCLTIRCDVTIMKETHIDGQSRVPPSDLHRHLRDLLYNRDAADLTFQVGGKIFSAHRCVLAARSSVFKAELLGAMQESSAASPIEICDMEPDVFESLLHFIYTDSVPAVLDVVMASYLLVAADRYNIGRLKLICEENLCNHIDSSMVATSLVLAEQHGFHHLKEACLKFLATPSNLEAMVAKSDGYEHLKSSCPSLLKEVISTILPAELK
ncbi:BTB/POZ and MATH domain-containing protein 3-like [Triticum aestivum]|uniref:BTB/POZ and MATH domain-containing protein 3-like n=1 Tax=Triticum aestivum TaxID=4565 RepID=UPI001D01371E|nr:BTB/POZ and MATH domain-containing protein 3-like [Triticum aestivum]